ncbi:MAG: hypothetical protein WC087_00305 [Candidatus Paceibacterota bacterium]
MTETRKPINVFDALSSQDRQNITRVEERVEEVVSAREEGGILMGSQKLVEIMQESDRQISEATTKKGMSPEELTQMRERILSSTLGGVRANVAQEEKDLADAMLAMTTVLQKINEGYASLGKENPEDIALVSEAEFNLKQLEEQMILAKNKTNLFFMRDRAVTSLVPKIEDAKSQVEEAKVESKRRARQRLKEASMEDSFDAYITRTRQVIEITEQSRANGQEMLVEATKQMESVFKAKDMAIKALTECEGILADLQHKMQEEESKLGYITKGSVEYSEQEEVIANIGRELEEARVARNNAFVLSSSKTEYAEEFRLITIAIQRLVGNLQSFIIQLKSGCEERAVTFKARLASHKLLSDQEALKNLDEVGAQIDLNNREAMVSMVVAADAAMTDMLAQMPGRRKSLEEVKIVSAQNAARTRDLINAMVLSFKDQYGLDPFASSETSYGEGGV